MKNKIEERIHKLMSINKEIYFWFRDDDVALDDKKYYVCTDYFGKQNISLLLAVIPKILTRVTANSIIECGGINFVGQHGYSHYDYSINQEKSELCKNREIEKLIYEQKIGRDLLINTFKKQYFDVLIPPYFHIDKTVLNAVNMLGYKCFSMWGKNNIQNSGICNINVQVDFIKWERGNFYAGNKYVESQIFQELSGNLAEKIFVGIVLHHKYLNSLSFDELGWIISLRKFSNVKILDYPTVYSLYRNE